MSRDVPVPRWPLSELGKKRMPGLRQPCGARGQVDLLQHRAEGDRRRNHPFPEHPGVPFVEVPELARTTVRPPAFYRRTNSSASRTSSSPRADRLVRAGNAPWMHRSRSSSAIERIAEKTEAVIAIVAHGAVGTLLYCHLAGRRSRGAGTSRRTAAAITFASRYRRAPRIRGGSRSTRSAARRR